VLKHPIYPRDIKVFEHPQCNIFQLDGIKHHIGMGRAKGFQLGDSKYVSFYDDDDEVLPQHISEIISILDNNDTLSGVVTSSNIVTQDNIREKRVPLIDKQTYRINDVKHMHQLIVLRRTATTNYIELLNQCGDWCEFALWTQMVLDGHIFQYFNKVCYNWHIHNENAVKLKISPGSVAVNLIKTMMSYPSYTLK
jgi:hypothetical protein